MDQQRAIPDFLIEYFLLGRTRAAAVEQYLKDGGVTTDVWLAFGKALAAPIRVLVAPVDGFGTAELGHALHRALHSFRRRTDRADRPPPGISPLEDYVAANIYLDELLGVLLPLTSFYTKNRLDQLNGDPAAAAPSYTPLLEGEILRRLGRPAEPGEGRTYETAAAAPGTSPGGEAARIDRERRRGINAAAPVAAVIGLLAAWTHSLSLPAGMTIEEMDPRRPGAQDAFNAWIVWHADHIADCAGHVLSRPDAIADEDLSPPAAASDFALRDDEGRRRPLIQRVFIDREAKLAHKEAVCTVKADAAQLLFEISCQNIGWAIIDSGIAARHPSFTDHKRARRSAARGGEVPTRVRGTYDFTMISQIRNFDLIEGEPDSEQERQAISRLIEALAALPVRRRQDPPFAEVAARALKEIVGQLRLGLMPHWRLIEPLIAIEPDHGEHLVSDHGTHVAGTLGGDWRNDRDEPVLRGMCPDISLYDLRVIPYAGHGGGTQAQQKFATESAVLAALEFVQYLNSRTMVRTQVVHGVNISMSIPHDVRNYGCGATPVCVASDRLVGSGVVVVAAAGNRGWNEQEMGFGSFAFCSITDPGNAREVITVGSTHPMKPHIYGVSYFSSRGPTGDGRIKPDLVAPGEGIRAPIRNEAEAELSGTSMAAPFVSGAAAMLMARHPELIGQPGEIKKTLCDNATDLQRERYFQGHGLLDVLRAIQSR